MHSILIFFEWSNKNEININNNGLILKENESNGYRGLYTSHDIHENEILKIKILINSNYIQIKLYIFPPSHTTTNYYYYYYDY